MLTDDPTTALVFGTGGSGRALANSPLSFRSRDTRREAYEIMEDDRTDGQTSADSMGDQTGLRCTYVEYVGVDAVRGDDDAEQD